MLITYYNVDLGFTVKVFEVHFFEIFFTYSSESRVF